jgi:hypothetical protein
MPYIKQTERDVFDEVLNRMPALANKGQLEYCIFKLMLQFMEDRLANYSNLHDCIYAAIHAGDEFRRRFLDRREDEVREDNGDVLARGKVAK